MVESVEEGAHPPPELELALMCQKWNALPEQGALLDQDAGLLKRMSGSVAIMNALNRWRSTPGKQIHTLTEGERKVLAMLRDMGLLFNG